MVARNYSNIAIDTTLSSGIGASDTSLIVGSALGWPIAPFLLVIAPDTAGEELILVGAKSGTTFSSLTRGFGGTSAVSHNAGVDIKHVTSADDHTLIWSHKHQGAGGDDTAQVLHSSLGGVSADQHHDEVHAHDGVDGSGTVLHSDTTGKTTDDHHPEAHTHDGVDAGTAQVAHGSTAGITTDDHHAKLHAAEHAAAGTDPISVATAMLQDLAVTVEKIADGAVTGVKAAAAFLQSFEVDGSIEVASAATTSSFSNVASVTLPIPASWGSWKCYAIATWVGGISCEGALNIDGAVQQVIVVPGLSVAAVVGRRVGMVTTGNRTVHFRGRTPGGASTFTDITLYARAVRTS